MTAARLALASILLIPLVAQATVPGLAPQKNWDLGGYIKYMATGTIADEGENGLDHLLHQRFNFEYRFSDSLRVNAGMRNRVLAGDTAELPGFGGLVGRDDGYLDLTHNWIDKSGLVGTTTFDRLYLDWQDNDWQLRGGRFRINWAMATLWNPNDLFNSYSIYDFDYEERPGSDAVLVSRKLGFASQLDLVYNPARESEFTSYAGRYLFNRKGWDGQILVGKSGLDAVIGVGMAGDIGGAGVRGEVSRFEPTRDSWQEVPLEAATVATLESDYSFVSRRNWMVRGALLYISNPQEPDSALAFLNLPLTARTLSFTRWSGYGDVSADLTALTRLTLSATAYDDGSYFVGLNASHSLADDWQLLGVVQRFDGSSDSLFGETPATLLFGQIRWNF
ncbi:hypothetical protein [Ferrimonas balearica]|uniref:hypothetical protein n=1 Tax=Ferrimonas balearica TaxID=44012 RepID=UPI001C992378|nr:hypothetical protein [Ferrimonas balearica]MBY5920764.1 hypothetical protein [Ferrimonas balearica]MBY5996551.1 hypothetical protein [Ferrimonas balearica]